ncbi:MAG: Ppx/GppA phosphatase family protein [Capsulimonas sp.]|uniref:Ppx/GppA phosphatase family protein n=1 Tax=Capsulimonas sp. TaxID=2494211 RepID=UPI003265490F
MPFQSALGTLLPQDSLSLTAARTECYDIHHMRIFAAMDIGTNSIRLAVVELQEGLAWNVLASQKQVVRLGEGEFAETPKHRTKKSGGEVRHKLTEEAIARGALVCARFAEVARGYGATEIVALATAAAREADNRDDFVEKVRELADLDVRVISGQEEARLIYLGVSSGVEIPAGKKALFIDIGGGSTELIVGDSNRFYYLDSLKLGAIRMTSGFVDDPSKPVSPANWALLQREVQSALAPAARAIAAEGFSVMYGSSGTAINLAEIAAHASGGAIPTSFRNHELLLTDLQAITKRLCALPMEQRRRVPGINPERADIIIGGAAILQTVMETVGATSIRISDRGVREGIVVDHLRREAGGAAVHETVGARRGSIQQLMRATNVDEAHALHIVHLSLRLFDQWKALGLHDYGRSRELLEYAALLHDCGFFISHTDHQQHSYYIIRHSELLGFNDREVEIMACLALYHRKGVPRMKHPTFEKLDVKTRKLVRILSCALRLAEALDRGHLAQVKDVRCRRLTKPDRIRMTLISSSDAQLEFWAALAQAPAFEKTFGMPLDVQVAGD